MKILIADHAQQLNEMAADMIQQLIQAKPSCVLGLATGSTPIGTYQELIRRHREEGLDFSQVKSFNLDEYYGLAEDHPQSYHRFMYQHLFDHINMNPANIHIPSGQPDDVEQYCEEYEAKIAAEGGIDLQILGIGLNGHIGFNEPAKELKAKTHLVQLTDSTIEANSRFFTSKDEVPKFAITMGMGTILKARKLLLLATGKGKAEIIRQLVHSEITTELPASMLKLHADATILVDRDAASLL